MAIRPGNAPLNCIGLTPAGSTRAGATQIPTNLSPGLVVAAGDGAAGIRLPKAVAGKQITVKNTGGGGLLVYPNVSTDQINAITAGSAMTMATLTCATFNCFNGTVWYTSPLLPS